MTFMTLYLCTCCSFCLNAHLTVGMNTNNQRTKVQVSPFPSLAFPALAHCFFPCPPLSASFKCTTIYLEAIVGRLYACLKQTPPRVVFISTYQKTIP